MKVDIYQKAVQFTNGVVIRSYDLTDLKYLIQLKGESKAKERLVTDFTHDTIDILMRTKSKRFNMEDIIDIHKKTRD